ncbi:hypothetical protein ACFE04_002690 [Oxalis oulophora]
MSEERWCLVTGGRGFAARHLIELLIKRETLFVRVADLGLSIDLEPDEEEDNGGLLGQALRSGRAVYLSMDLRNKDQVILACKGVEAVFHMAAPNSSINNYDLHRSVNVLGTQNVIDACLHCKVKRLIYTSSPSVVFDGIHGIVNGNDIFGPGDRLFIPSVITAARAGKAKFMIGDGNNVYDFTYVENVAHAHVCAERALASEELVAEKAAGQAYFITNMEPIKFWEFFSQIVEGFGYERPRIKIPAVVVMPIAHVVELAYKFLGPYGMPIPQFIPSRIRLLSCSRSFDCSKAKERLGYTPIVSLQEGLKRTIESYPHLRAENRPKREGPSKASIFLGSGKVADALLLKNKRLSLIAALVLIAIYYNFISSGSTLITALSKVLLAGSTFLFIHGSLPGKISDLHFDFLEAGLNWNSIFCDLTTDLHIATSRWCRLGYTIEKIPEARFHLSEENSHSIGLSVASSWNRIFRLFKTLCQGNDSALFFKVVISLLTLSFLGAISLRSFFVIGLPILFTAFSVYEKREQEIDAMVLQALSKCGKLKTQVATKFLPSDKND